MYELSTAFELAPDSFLEKYNIPKPNKEQSIVFSCAKGIRSLKACHYAMELGYKKYITYLPHNTIIYIYIYIKKTFRRGFEK